MEKSNFSEQALSLPGRQRFSWKALFPITLTLLIAQGLTWSMIISPKYGIFFLFLLLFGAIFVTNIEIGVLAIIFVIPWAWRAIDFQTGFASFKVSYILITFAFGYFLFKWLITKDIRWVRTPLDRPLLLFLAINLLSIIVSIEPLWSLREVFQIALYAMFYFLITNTLKTKEAVIKAANIVILATASVALVGLFGLSGVSKMEEFQIQRVLTGFSDANLSANYLLMGFPLAFALIFGKQKTIGKRIPYFIAWAAIGAALIFTYSRAGWLVGILTLLLVSFLAKTKIKGIAILAAAILILSFLNISSVEQRTAQISSLEQNSTLSHLYLWKASLGIIEKYPLLGIGAGAFPRFFEKYEGTPFLPPPEMLGKRVYFAKRSGYGVPVHNALLQIWTELGTFGFLAFLFVIGVFIKTMLSAIRKIKDSQAKLILIGLFASALGVLLHNLSITNLIEHFWAALAIAISTAGILMPQKQTEKAEKI